MVQQHYNLCGVYHALRLVVQNSQRFTVSCNKNVDADD